MTAPDPGLTIRGVDPGSEDFSRFVAALALSFGFDPAPHPDRAAALRAETQGDRDTGAYTADGTLVGTYSSRDTTLTVPGGTVTADAVTAVSVRPTHRRRGALTAMITADLAAAVARGVPVAVLIAAEATIYGRYGFAPATQVAAWEVDLPAARPRPGVRRDGSLEIVPEAALRDLGPELYARTRGPGAIDRDGGWWDRALGLATRPGDEHTAAIAVVHRDGAGAVQGCLRYSAKEHWEARLSHTLLSVRELVAATPQAYAALWGYLLEQDQVAGVRADGLAVDEPLPWLLTDGRRARLTSRTDFQWSRLLDPAAALSARRYEGRPGAVRFEVVDPLGWAAGHYLLDVDGSGRGRCAREPDPGVAAELTVDVAALSACWLGGGDLLAAAVAGQVSEHVPGATQRLGGLLHTLRAPHTSTWF